MTIEIRLTMATLTLVLWALHRHERPFEAGTGGDRRAPGVWHGNPYLVMELVVGGSIEDERSRFGDVAWALSVIGQVARGVATLHRAGVVHRDPWRVHTSRRGRSERRENWVDNAKITDSGVFRWCVLNPSAPGAFVGLRSFDIVRAPGGIEYAVIATGGPVSGNFVRLFMSPAGGIKGFQNQASTIRTWFEWCKGTPVSNVIGAPRTNWRNVEKQGPCPVPAFTGTGPSVTFPTIAADGRGRLAVTYYESNPADTQLRVMFQGNLNPQDPTSDFQALPLTPFFPLPTGFVNRPLGDYMSIAVKSSGATPSFNGGCTTIGDFFPIWIQPGAPTPMTSGPPEVAFTGVSMSP